MGEENPDFEPGEEKYTELAKKTKTYGDWLYEGGTISFRWVRKDFGDHFAMNLRELSSVEGKYLVTTPNNVRRAYNQTVDTLEDPKNANDVNEDLGQQELESNSKNEDLDEKELIYQHSLREMRIKEEDDSEENQHIGFH